MNTMMKFVLLFLLLNGFSCSDASSSEDPPDTSGLDLPGWELVWHDEFDGTRIDGNKWEHEVNAQEVAIMNCSITPPVRRTAS